MLYLMPGKYLHSFSHVTPDAWKYLYSFSHVTLNVWLEVFLNKDKNAEKGPDMFTKALS